MFVKILGSEQTLKQNISNFLNLMSQNQKKDDRGQTSITKKTKNSDRGLSPVTKKYMLPQNCEYFLHKNKKWQIFRFENLDLTAIASLIKDSEELENIENWFNLFENGKLITFGEV